MFFALRVKPKSTELPILWSDDNLVAVAKPAGLATIPGRGETDSVLERLADQIGLLHTGTSDPRLRVVHRLDKNTSGVLLFAKNISAQRHLSHEFQNNTIGKEYVALVAGRPSQREGEIDAPLAPHPTSPKRMTVSKHGRPARTLWKVEETFRDFVLLRCFPKTGKTHQIRIHFAEAGHPLVGETVYIRDFEAAGHRLLPSARLLLHAATLGFEHPVTGDRVRLEAALPEDFVAAVTALR